MFNTHGVWLDWVRDLGKEVHTIFVSRDEGGLGLGIANYAKDSLHIDSYFANENFVLGKRLFLDEYVTDSGN